MVKIVVVKRYHTNNLWFVQIDKQKSGVCLEKMKMKKKRTKQQQEEEADNHSNSVTNDTRQQRNILAELTEQIFGEYHYSY